MRKHNISKFSKWTYCVAFLFIIAGIIFTIVGYKAVGFTLEVILFSFMSIISVISISWLLFFDAPSGKFSFDSDGITLFVGFKSYHHKWDEFKWLDVIPISVESVGAKTVANMYVVWFSTRCLSLEERRNFMSKGRKDLNCVAWFQYRSDFVSEIIDYLPPHLAIQLQKKHNVVQENMNLLELLYNRD